MHRALLVGVNEYAKQLRLSGCANDVIGVQQLLVSQGGVAAANMIVLTNADATRSALVDALIEMVDALEPGDRGYFHFSGHCVRMDLNDPEGMNEVLCPHDFDWRPETSFTDAELRAILNALCLGARFLVSINAYHAPEFARGLGLLNIVQEQQHVSFNFIERHNEANHTSASSCRRHR